MLGQFPKIWVDEALRSYDTLLKSRRERKVFSKPNKSLNFGFLQKMFLKFFPFPKKEKEKSFTVNRK
jgi:hypothetical protein